MSSSPRRGGGGGGRDRGRPKRAPRKSGPAPRELHPILDPPDIPNFAAWDLDPGILQGIANQDIEVPTPIQALSIQPILDGKDLIAKAETGTGKTLAFGAPMMSKIDADRSSVLALVLCPTRELAQQVAGVLSALGVPRGVSVALVVGGDPLQPQVQELQKGAQVVVGTPGRVLDLYSQRFLSFPWTEYAVLDEADKMFEIGFLDDVRKILALLPDERQTLLFSATYPNEVLNLAREFTTDPVEVATARGLATVSSIDQVSIAFNDEEDRPLALIRLVEGSEPDDVFLVFLERRTDVDRLLRRLERESFSVKALHGGYDQASRFRVMSAFRTGEVKVLLATDVASRGLDVEHVTHVLNFAVPRDVESYTHRIGRTGRAGRSGKAITFVVPADRRRWQAVLRGASWDIGEVDPPGRPRRDARDDRPRSGEDRSEGDRSERSRSNRPARSGPDRPARDRSSRDRSSRDARGDRDDRPAKSTKDTTEPTKSGKTRRRWVPPGATDSPAQPDSSKASPSGAEPQRESSGALDTPPRRRRGGRGRNGGGGGS